MKWKLVPAEATPEMVCKAEEDSPPFYHGDPWYGSEPPSEGQINAIYKAMLDAAPQPPALTDERILELMGFRVKGVVFGELKAKHAIELARAIEREIFGGGE